MVEKKADKVRSDLLVHTIPTLELASISMNMSTELKSKKKKKKRYQKIENLSQTV